MKCNFFDRQQKECFVGWNLFDSIGHERGSADRQMHGDTYVVQKGFKSVNQLFIGPLLGLFSCDINIDRCI